MTAKINYIYRGQFWHFLLMTTSIVAALYFIDKHSIELEGKLFGVSSRAWFIAAILAPIFHQLFVAICWRLELYKKFLSRIFGTTAFLLFKIGFFTLFLSRMIFIIVLAISNAGTMSLKVSISYSIATLLSIPALYLFYSVKKYFGMDRAFGIDHFEPEKYKTQIFVKKGIFKYSSNAMYVYGFLILWVPAFLFSSKLALIAALFNHLYIWVHYYFTELPDIQFIYGDDK